MTILHLYQFPQNFLQQRPSIGVLLPTLIATQCPKIFLECCIGTLEHRHLLHRELDSHNSPHHRPFVLYVFEGHLACKELLVKEKCKYKEHLEITGEPLASSQKPRHLP